MPKRIDVNQPAIVKIFRELGCSVLILSDLGKGCPDILLGFRGKNYLIEIKNGARPKSGRTLTPAEMRFFEGWLGQVDIIASEDEAIEFIKIRLRWDEHDQSVLSGADKFSEC